MLINDFFKWTLVISVAFHLFIVLGISFVMPGPLERSLAGPPLHITLVAEPTLETPPDSEIIAQFNSDGREQAPSPQAVAANLALPLPTPVDDAGPELLSAVGTETVSGDSEQRDQAVNHPALVAEINIAHLNARSRPREKYVGARTRESKYAAYIEKWRLLVERVGNLNYPEAAKQQSLEGELVLDVAIDADGTVHKVRLLRSSGHKVLDDAATRIVHIAAPFDRFPDALRKELDILHIVRTWTFGQGKLISTTVPVEQG